MSRLFSSWRPQPVREMVSLEEAAGRVLFEDQYALYNIPMVRASAMDGIAVRPIICGMLGTAVPVRETLEAVLTADFQMPPLSLMACFRLKKGGNGEYFATQLQLRGPHSAGAAAVLTADAVYVTTPGERSREAGEKIRLELLKNRADL